MLLTYRSLIFSVSSSFIVTSACSSPSTSFLKSKPVSRFEDGCEALFFLLFFVIEVLESSLRFMSFLYFCNHAFWLNILS